ncbi:beta-propeller domain-containing protein [Candidatus Xianfuyuplasma coldseepsis]|uniref:Thioredoxin domain-containing protein n=1 Tax=Candidatus Xianfuyuplasma coldseepsis TaxID=2782163 RepID=A0A7L7KPE5_9MOLU|nr:beta-propeller domain-containing protein [Xianfuyuplasma coldseepsis]QMS84651.1 hypothetical protein G4Z02_02425 [Xianfuyuplasma coldseepsis]
MRRLLIAVLGLLFLTGCNALNEGKIVIPEYCSEGFHLVGDLCVENDDTTPTEAQFTSSDDLMSLVADFNERYDSASPFIATRGGWVDMEFDATAEDAPTATNDEQGSDDYSETNNQVEGVDEMDNVLTDGKYLYITNYNKVQIVLAYTIESGINNMALVEEITFDELQGDHDYFYFTGLYVDEERLLIVGHSYDYACDVYYDEKIDEEGDVTTEDDIYYQECWYYRSTTTTHVFEYDKADFSLVNEYQMSGYFVGSRKIDDNMYFVTNEYIPFYLAETDENFDLDQYLPSYNVNGQDVFLDYEDILYMDGTQPYNFTSFFGINLETKEVSTEVVLGEGGYNMYVSTNNIYFTGTSWNFNMDVLVAVEEAVEADDEEALDEIDDNPYEISTSIMKLSINDGIVDFVAETSVPGSGLDQFAFDEHNGYLRLVTTEFNWWWGWWMEDATENEINNRLYVLDEDLNVVSTLEGIGKPGESVQSVRFVGDYAYVVTFLRTDPFYVIDLSDPANPVKLSELIIPGFSDYLQPINEDYILGIGYGDNDGGTNGLKISLYDVSDKTEAVVASELIYPYSDNSYMWTSTLYNHKDLVVSVDKGIIALPYNRYEYGSTEDNWWYRYNTGVLVLNLDIEDGEISERGWVEHSESNSYDTYVYKSKFISDYLFTISSKFVMVSLLDDPETILNQVQIGESREYDYPDEEVEPVDPEVVDPDTETGTGDATETIYSDFVHVYSWDEALHMGEHEYFVYVYSPTCSACIELEEIMLEFVQSSDIEVIFLNIGDVDNLDDYPYDAYPLLARVNQMDVFEEYLGSDEIFGFIQ